MFKCDQTQLDLIKCYSECNGNKCNVVQCNSMQLNVMKCSEMYLMIIDGFNVEPHALAKWTKPLPHLHNVRLHMATAAGKVEKSRFAKTPEIDRLL